MVFEGNGLIRSNSPREKDYRFTKNWSSRDDQGFKTLLYVFSVINILWLSNFRTLKSRELNVY